MSDRDPDPDRVQDRAEQRQSQRADDVERILDDVERDLGNREYPVRPEELAEEYADQPLDMANETESLGSVFDRMTGTEEFDSPEEVREAVYGELTGRAAGPEEYNDQRDLEEVAGTEDETQDL